MWNRSSSHWSSCHCLGRHPSSGALSAAARGQTYEVRPMRSHAHEPTEALRCSVPPWPLSPCLGSGREWPRQAQTSCRPLARVLVLVLTPEMTLPGC